MLTYLTLQFPGKYWFDVFHVGMIALNLIRTVGELTAQKPVFIVFPLKSACEMLGSRENDEHVLSGLDTLSSDLRFI